MGKNKYTDLAFEVAEKYHKELKQEWQKVLFRYGKYIIRKQYRDNRSICPTSLVIYDLKCNYLTSIAI